MTSGQKPSGPKTFVRYGVFLTDIRPYSWLINIHLVDATFDKLTFGFQTLGPQDIWPTNICLTQTHIWPMVIWIADIWLTDLLYTDIWSTDIWPTDIGQQTLGEQTFSPLISDQQTFCLLAFGPMSIGLYDITYFKLSLSNVGWPNVFDQKPRNQN